MQNNKKETEDDQSGQKQDKILLANQFFLNGEYTQNFYAYKLIKDSLREKVNIKNYTKNFDFILKSLIETTIEKQKIQILMFTKIAYN